MNIFYILFFILLISFGVSGKRVVCYFKSALSNIVPDPKICTHIVYAFLNIAANGTLISFDDNNSFETLAAFSELKNENSSVKLLIGIGGGTSVNFPNISVSETAIETLGRSITDFLDEYNLDGADINWENLADSTPELFSGLLSGVRDIMPADKILLVDVYPDRNQAQKYYDALGVSSLVDFINLMTYNFHGAWEPHTYYHAPLYSGPLDKTDYWKTLNINASVEYWVSQGVPSDKLVIGVPLYGRTYILTDPNENGIGANTSGAGSPSFLRYHEICENVQKTEWTSHYFEPQAFHYAFKDEVWVSYDGLESLTAKLDYVIENNLGGVMFWSLDMDDYSDKCGNGKSPMISLAYNTLVQDDNLNITTISDTTIFTITEEDTTSDKITTML